MSERQIALEASPQIRTQWFLKTATIIFQDCEASPNLAVRLGLYKCQMIPRYIWQIWQLSIKLGDLPHKQTTSKNLSWYLMLISSSFHISNQIFLIFLLNFSHRCPSHLDFHIDAPEKKCPSELRWLHRFLDNSRDWSYWRRHQCTAMSTPPVNRTW